MPKPLGLALLIGVIAACGQTRVPAQVAQTLAPAQMGSATNSGLPLITESNLTYVGAFRLPVVAEAEGAGYNACCHAIGFNPANASLILSLDEGLNQYNSYLGEVSIPTPLNGVQCVRNGAAGCSGTELNEATPIQSPTDVFNGTLATCGDARSGCVQRGIYVDGNNLYLAAYVNYDGAYLGYRSHFKRSTDFSNKTVAGPFELNAFGHSSALNGGAGGGFITHIPTAWQSALGGDTLSSNWNISINSRASWGPPAIIYKLADVGVVNPIPATALVFYNVDHPTLGKPQQPLAQWNDVGRPGGLVFVEGTSTILFINAHTDHPCYGVATTNPALAGQPTGTGDAYCLDPEHGDKGDHGNPWTQRIMAYDAHDLVAVKQGSKAPYQVKPYASWDFTFPQFQYTHFIKAAAYDPATQRIYLASQYGDARGCCYNAPVIHVYHVSF